MIMCCIVLWYRVMDALSEKPFNFQNVSLMVAIALMFTFITGRLLATNYVIWKSGNVDLVLVTIFISMSVALVATAYSFEFARKNGWRFTKKIGYVLIVGPSLFWSLFWLAYLRILGPIHFDFFGTPKVVNTSFSVSFMIFLVLFIREFVGNNRNVEAKMAEVVTFWGGKRNGQALTEGFNPLPGILPLFVQVGIYALVRFSIFWGAVRGFVTTPIKFIGTIVAYSQDGMAVVFNLTGVLKISDPAIFDDLVDEGTNPREQLAKLAGGYIEQGANKFFRDYPWQTLADGSGFGSKLVKSMNGSMDHLGLKFVASSVEWLGFQDTEQQRIFQQLAGKGIRQLNQSMKAVEIDRIFNAMQLRGPGVRREEAERIWEAFTKDGRGSFRIGD